MWHKFNPNPHGSSVGDCAVRASGKLTCVDPSTATLETVTTGATAMPTEAVTMFAGITPARMAVSA